ncbi:MAG: hypothetical protein A3E80_06000, partial [Chlamydiae bacterium RIFCSPHIGHO2_12_FULL_49_9]
MRPRATISRIVSENPKRSLWLLAFIYGFSSLLNAFQTGSMGAVFSTPLILVAAAILAPFWGYACFAFFSWVVLWIGKIFKGHGTFAGLRAVYAWSCVPMILNIPLWLLMVMMFGQALFLNIPPQYVTEAQAPILFLILISKVVLAVWSLVIYLNGLAQVQQYSMLKAIFNTLIAGAIALFLLGIVWSFGFYLLDVSLQNSQTA